MWRQKLIPKFEFSVYLSSKLNSSASELIFGGTDPAHYSGAFVYADVLLPSYWLVGAENVYARGHVAYKCPLEYCPMVIDTGTSILVFPPYIGDPLLKAIGTVQPDCSNVHTLPTIAFSLGGISGGAVLNLTADYYVLRLPAASGAVTCVLGIETSWLVAPLSILGDPFLRAYYSVYDRANNRVGFAPAK